MITAPRRSALGWIGITSVVALTALVIAFDFGAFLSVYDGGISASGATFTLHGLLPYRDYWLLYGPISGVLLAIPTTVLGPSVDLSRLVGGGVFCVQAVMAYGVARTWAARGPAIALSVSAVVMLPAVLGLDVSAWPIAMTLALAAIYVSIRTERSGLLVGLLVGLAFLSRLDVGVYALAAVLLVRSRRDVLIGFAVVAVPFVLFLLATTPVPSLVEQLIWYPIVGPREFRGSVGPDLGDPVTAMFMVPLVFIPRAALLLAAIRLVGSAAQHRWDSSATRLLSLLVFAAACQLQTLGRADLEHFAQAVTPSILLLAVWFPAALPSPGRLGALIATTAACVIVGLTGHTFHGGSAAYDRTVLAVSAWVRDSTTRDDRTFVGLTDNRFTVANPLLIYYLADRASGVRDAMFNPGVTNTDWGQRRMVEDLARTTPPFVVLDRESAGLREATVAGGIPGSTLLDDYLRAHYRTVCDLGSLVIQARTHVQTTPACPSAAP